MCGFYYYSLHNLLGITEQVFSLAELYLKNFDIKTVQLFNC